MLRHLRLLTLTPVLAAAVLFAVPAGASPCTTLATIHPLGAAALPSSTSTYNYLSVALAKIDKNAALARRYELTLRALAPHLGAAKAPAVRAAADFTKFYEDDTALYHAALALAADRGSSAKLEAVTSLVLKTNSAAITSSFAVLSLREDVTACR